MISLSRGRIAASLAVAVSALVFPSAFAPAQADTPDCSSERSEVLSARAAVVDAVEVRNQHAGAVRGALQGVADARAARNDASVTFEDARSARAEAYSTFLADRTPGNRQAFYDARDAQQQAATDYTAAKQSVQDAWTNLDQARADRVTYNAELDAARTQRTAAQAAFDTCQNPPAPTRIQTGAFVVSGSYNAAATVVTISGLTPNTTYSINPETFCLGAGYGTGCAASITSGNDGTFSTSPTFDLDDGFPIRLCGDTSPTGQVRVYDSSGTLVIDEQVPVPDGIC